MREAEAPAAPNVAAMDAAAVITPTKLTAAWMEAKTSATSMVLMSPVAVAINCPTVASVPMMAAACDSAPPCRSTLANFVRSDPGVVGAVESKEWTPELALRFRASLIWEGRQVRGALRSSRCRYPSLMVWVSPVGPPL